MMFGVFNHPERRHSEGCQPHQNKEDHVSRILVWLPPRCRLYYCEIRSEAPGMKPSVIQMVREALRAPASSRQGQCTEHVARPLRACTSGVSPSPAS